jgi:hypothetical protein
MTLRMTVSEGLAEQMGQIAEQVPSSLGIDIALSIFTLGPSVTVVTTNLFTSEAFRIVLHRWCKHVSEPTSVTLKAGRDKISLDLDECTANKMAPEISGLISKFIEVHPER